MPVTFNPSKYVKRWPRALPVLLLLDASGSMDTLCRDSSTSRIAALNNAVRNMLQEFASLCTKDSAITVAALSFNDGVSLLHLDGESVFSLASCARWTDLQAQGGTRLDLALAAAKEMMEDTKLVPSNSYRPLVILLSDGEPWSGWEEPMRQFCTEGRAQKCDRLAIMLGEESNKESLKKFVKGTDNPVLRAETARQISRFFKLVTMTVTQRFHSQNPNLVTAINEEKAQQFLDGTSTSLSAESADLHEEDFYF